MPSKMEFYTFPRLKSAKKEVDSSNHMDYKSGATFQGQLAGRKRVGRGVFVWPNGDRYEGDYVDNERHGEGLQLWADGSQYEGEFMRDTRHGEGQHTWKDGESFKGSYFKDHRHGKGTYTWPDGSKFEGTFYKNKKEGYGTFKFSSGNQFQGLYINDERGGPGTLLYPDGNQDVGLWRKERLVKLCSPVDQAFTMADHTDFEYDPKEHILTLKVNDPSNPTTNRGVSLHDDSQDSAHINHSLRRAMEKLSKMNFSTSFESFQSSVPESVDYNTLTYDREEYEKAFSGEGGERDSVQSLTALNNTPSLIELQLHVMKHRQRESAVGFSVDDILHGKRDSFQARGPIEVMSEELIRAAATGEYPTVHSLLSKGAVNVNVADRNGHIALIGAAVHMHRNIINCILDNGADVNKLNDEGLSALAACHVLFYPIQSFKYNIAERYLPVPPGEERSEVKLDLDHSIEMDSGGEEQEPPAEGQRSEAGSALGSQRGDGAAPPEGDKDFYDVESPVKDVQAEEEEDVVAEWDRDNESVEERGSLRKRGSLLSKKLSSQHPGTLGDKTGSTSTLDFETDQSLGYGVEVTEEMIERSATAMSKNPRVVSRGISRQEENLDEARRRAIDKAEHSEMEATIRLLLRRGADPNASSVPMPVIFFAIKAADVDAVSILLQKGAATEARLSPHKEGLSPLHIASAIRGPEGVEITRLLLEAGAYPNSRASDQDLEEDLENLSPLDSSVKLKPGLDPSVFVFLQELEASGDHSGGRSPLHIACDRDDDYELSRQVVHLLLDHGANPNVLCRGQSPLSLAIASGNDLAIDELLRYQANPSLPLGQSIGSALCVAANTQYEFRRTPPQRIALIDKLVKAGANILAPIAVGAKRQMGSAVDYAYWMFNQDRRIAHMPYHALTHAERDTYNARRKLLSHLGEILRGAAVRREKERLDREDNERLRSFSPSHGFLYTGAGAKPSQLSIARSGSPSRISSAVGGGAGGQEGGKQVAFQATTKDNSGKIQPLVDKDGEITVRPKASGDGNILMVVDTSGGSCDEARGQRLVKQASRSHIRKPLFRYCYECGRSIGVRLSACTRCKEVYYCSKACKIKAWNARHKEECLRVGGRSRSPSPATAYHNGNNSAGNTGSNAKGQAGGVGSNAKGHTTGVNSIGKSQHGSVKGQHGSVKGQQGSVKGQKGTTGAMNSIKGHGGKNGSPGGKGHGVNKGSKGKGLGQTGGGDNGMNEQSNNNPFNTSGREVLNVMKPECTENYSYV